MTSYDRGAPLRYFAAATPGWVLASAVAYGLYVWAGMSAWATVLVPALWIAADVVMYPRRRRFYESEPPWRWLVGEQGVALTPLQPEGLVRLRGEIWHARLAAGAAAIPKASRIRVRAVEGLRVIVDAELSGEERNASPD